MTKDPVCGMEVDPKQAAAKTEYKGRTYYFCAGACRETFSKNPEKYLAKKGRWGRFLEKIASTGQEEFKGQAPSCHKKWRIRSLESTLGVGNASIKR